MAHFEVQPAEVLWLIRPEELDQLHDVPLTKNGVISRKSALRSPAVCKLKGFLSETLGILFDFKDIRRKSDLNVYNTVSDKEKVCEYEEHLYTISCDLRLDKDFIHCYSQLIKKYCSSPKTKGKSKDSRPVTWLQLDLNPILGGDDIRSYIPELRVQHFALGNFSGLTTFVEHFNSETSCQEKPNCKITQVRGRFFYDQGKFELYFIVGKSDVPSAKTKRTISTHRIFKLEMFFSNIKQVVICNSEKFTAYLRYLNPPLLYAVPIIEIDQPPIYFDDVTPQTYWQRVIQLFDGCPPHWKLSFCMNTVMKLAFSREEYSCFLQLLKFNKSVEIYFSSFDTVQAVPNVQMSGISSNNFECFYALKCILTRSFEFVDQLIGRDEVKVVNKFFQDKSDSEKKLKILTDTLYVIYKAIERGSVDICLTTIKKMYEKAAEQFNASKCNSAIASESEEIVYIKRAYLFPTHVRFVPPQSSLKNRILDGCSPENFMRVTVRDVDFQSINFTVRGFGGKEAQNYRVSFFDKQIKHPLAQGIKLGTKRFSYVGASQSQLKSHSLWYFATDPSKPDLTVITLRKQIGDLDAIVEVPKFMARMGLSFSQAIGRTKVDQKLTNVDDPEPDIEGEPKKYLTIESDDESDSKKKRLKGKYVRSSSNSSSCEDSDPSMASDNSDDETKEPEKPDNYVFSDGIGKMSQEIADQIYKDLKIEDERPSAVQIRYAGCKGMLVVDPTLKGKQIIFRDSMKKYNSTNDSLEILKTSKPRRIHLSRHFIAILEEKGIHKEVFLKLQKEMIHDLVKSIFYDEKTADMLNNHCTLRMEYKKLLDAGFSFTEDPFFRSLMLSIFKQQVQLLKSKARISIPVDYARNMFGVLDETGTLEYGQVFVQYTKWDIDETLFLEGPVIVTKTPCLHIGDVRKFQAVYVDGLRHIRDCIVFPAKGIRPHPDEMSGSDLDGDEYMVVWLKDLIFEGRNSIAMDYAVPKPKKTERDKPISVTEELDHFRNYILNDSVGQIANAYLAWADDKGMIDADGIMNPICLRLAKKHALAVDFAKSGKPSVMSRSDIKPEYPDFLEKKEGKRTYTSKKALGHLYRDCKSLEMGLDATSDEMEYRVDDDLIHQSWQKYEAAAQKTYNWYAKKVASLLRAYTINSEGELFSGCFSISQLLYPTSSDRNSVLEIVPFQVQLLFSQLEKEFFEEFRGKPQDDAFTDDMFCKASAWYVFSYKVSKEQGIPQYFSLPWAVSTVLIAFKQQKRRKFYPSDNFMAKNCSFIEKAIDKYVKKDLPSVDSVVSNDAAQDYKHTLLDISYEVLMKWLDMYEFLAIKKEAVKNCVSDVFDAISSKLVACSAGHFRQLLQSDEVKKVTSSGYYVLESLIRIAEMGMCADPNVSFGNSYQELGIFAWITLVKLACSGNVQYLGLLDKENKLPPKSFYLMADDIVNTVTISLRGDLLTAYIRAGDELREFLIKRSNVKKINMRAEETGGGRGKRKQDKEGKCKQNEGGKCKQDKDNAHYVLKITAQGSRFCFERLKDFVFGKDFLKELSKDKAIQKQITESLEQDKISREIEEKRKREKYFCTEDESKGDHDSKENSKKGVSKKVSKKGSNSERELEKCFAPKEKDCDEYLEFDKGSEKYSGSERNCDSEYESQ